MQRRQETWLRERDDDGRRNGRRTSQGRRVHDHTEVNNNELVFGKVKVVGAEEKIRNLLVQALV